MEACSAGGDDELAVEGVDEVLDGLLDDLALVWDPRRWGQRVGLGGEEGRAEEGAGGVLAG